MSEPLAEGWGFPGHSNKAHFFRTAWSLCGRWGFYRGPLEPDLPNGSPDECKPCAQKRRAELATTTPTEGR